MQLQEICTTQSKGKSSGLGVKRTETYSILLQYDGENIQKEQIPQSHDTITSLSF